MRDLNELCDMVRQTAYAIHCYHGHGHLEKVYENALAHRLRRGFTPSNNTKSKFSTKMGHPSADLMVEDALIVELKASRTLVSEHIAQILGYLRSARREHGLLINFGSYKFQIRKFAKSLDSI